MKTLQKCTSCHSEMEIDESLSGSEVQCPTCGAVNVAADFARVPAVQRSPEPVEARSHISKLRSGSCYRTLRSAIRLAFALVYLVLGASILGSVALINTGVSFPAMLGVMVADLASIAIALAMHQAMLLLVDIADAVVSSNAKAG